MLCIPGVLEATNKIEKNPARANEEIARISHPLTNVFWRELTEFVAL